MIRDFARSIRMYNHKVNDQFKFMVYNRSEEAFAEGNSRRDKIQSIEELDIYRVKMRSEFIEALGGIPPSNTPLNAKTTGVVKQDGFTIEKVIFESRPGHYVTANLYIPDNIKSPRGTVLFVCGHGKEAKQYPTYQTACRYMVKSGLVVFAQDPIGQGERFSYYEKSINDVTVRWGTTEHEYVGCQSLLLGDAIARYFIHDAMRSIDYLYTRSEVDKARIGITGNSGGGLQSSMMMICDPRITAAAPATFVMNRQEYMYKGEDQDAEQVWPAFTALGYDHEDILLSMAPRPVRVLSVKWDFFPIEGTRKTVSRCRRFWGMYGKGEYFDMIEDDSTHKYSRGLAKAAAEFFSLHLLGKKVSADDNDIEPLNPEILMCTNSGQVRGELKSARFIYDENCNRLDDIEKLQNSLKEREHREKALNWLRKKVFTGRKPHDLNPRFSSTQLVEEFQVETAFWWSQEGLFNHACMFRHFKDIGKDSPVTIAVWNDGASALYSHMGFIRETCSKGRAVMVLDITADGLFKPDDHEAHKLMDDLIWLDDSIVAIRIYDIIRALDVIDIWLGVKSDKTKVYAYGNYGIYAQLAAILDSRIKEVQTKECIESFTELVRERYYNFDFNNIMNIILPGILKYFDIHDAKQWLNII